MVNYCVKVCHGKKIIFAKDGERISSVVIDENKISTDALLNIFVANDVLPAHIKCIYEDLIS